MNELFATPCLLSTAGTCTKQSKANGGQGDIGVLGSPGCLEVMKPKDVKIGPLSHSFIELGLWLSLPTEILIKRDKIFLFRFRLTQTLSPSFSFLSL
jgi:hypothetical protein